MRTVRIAGCFLAMTLLALTAAMAGSEELTVQSILTSQKAGASTDGIIAMVNDPANTVAMTDGDIVTLRNARVSEAVIEAIQARRATPAGTPAPVLPDDARLVDLVRLIKSGISESIIGEQVKQSGQAYNLSVNDLRYLKNNGVLESDDRCLDGDERHGGNRGTRPAPSVPTGAAPADLEEMVFDGLVMKTNFLKKDRPGRLTLQGSTLVWTDGADPKENFEFQTTGLEKVWFTCQARTPENFCYQINFQIVKGARYEFQDVNRESGGNATVLDVMDALRTRFPQIAYGSPKD